MKLDTTFRKLYDNCVFSLIVHAISSLQMPELSFEQSWDGVTYCFHFNTLRGAISFDKSNEIVAGALREDLSERRSLYQDPGFHAKDFYNEASPEVKELAENEAMQYLYDMVDEKEMIVITSAFWGEKDAVCSYDEADELKKHGGEYILEQLCADRLELIEHKKEYHGFSGDDEITSAEYIFECFKKGQFKMKKKEVPIINKKCVGYKECLESLSELGIYIV